MRPRETKIPCSPSARWTKRCGILCIVWQILLSPLPILADAQSKTKNVVVVFRLDDCSAISSTDFEKHIIEIFQSHRASFTLGVIPFIANCESTIDHPNAAIPMSAEKIKMLADAVRQGVVEIAQHGYSHQTLKEFPRSEFAGLDFQTQLERLSQGKAILESIISAPITSFIPPWNRYDHNTLMALKQLGFRVLSADRVGKANLGASLSFVPATCRDPALVRSAVDAAKRSPDQHPLIIVMIHYFDFKEIDPHNGVITLNDLDELLNWLDRRQDIRVLSLSQAAATVLNLNAERFLRNRRHYMIERWMPRRLRTAHYQESPTPFKSIVLLIGVYLFIALSAAGLALWLGKALHRRSVIKADIGAVALFGLLVAVICHFSFHLFPHLFGALLVIGLGMSMGSALHFKINPYPKKQLS